MSVVRTGGIPGPFPQGSSESSDEAVSHPGSVPEDGIWDLEGRQGENIYARRLTWDETPPSQGFSKSLEFAKKPAPN